jgi:hypothetical protein
MARPVGTALIALAIVVVLGAGLVAFLLFAPASLLYSRNIRKGNEIVGRIEAFRQQQHGLPSSLAEAGMSESDQGKYFYKRCTDTRYIVWFGTSLGESMNWDSISHRWNDTGSGCAQ